MAWVSSSEATRALRSLLHRPVLPALAFLTLTIGIGTNAAILSAARAVLLKPLPYDRPSELVMIWRVPKGRPSILAGHRNEAELQRQIATPSMVLEWRSRESSLAAVSAIEFHNGPLSQIDLELGGETIERVSGASVTSAFFDTLGVGASRGRTFLPEDPPDVALISAALWRRTFASDPYIVGKTIEVRAGRERARKALTIVGVLPDNFRFAYSERIDLWTHLPWQAVEATNPGFLLYAAVARLRAGTSALEAETELRAAMDATNERDAVPPNRRMTVWLEPIHDYAVGRTRPAVSMLTGVSVTLLLVSCLSVAALLVARNAERSGEFAAKRSLGANPMRLAKEVLLEIALLSAASTLCAIAIVSGLQPLWSHILPVWTPRIEDIRLDFASVGWATLLAGVSAMLVGAAPTFLVSMTSTQHLMSQPASDRSRMVKQSILAFEACLVVALLMCGAWFLQSFWNLRRVDLGFSRDRVVSAELRLLDPAFRSPDRLRAFRSEVDARLSSLPFVRRVAVASAGPFAGTDSVETVSTVASETKMVAARRRIDPSYFEILGLRLVEGRLLQPEDSSSVAIIFGIACVRAVCRRSGRGADDLNLLRGARDCRCGF